MTTEDFEYMGERAIDLGEGGAQYELRVGPNLPKDQSGFDSLREALVRSATREIQAGYLAGLEAAARHFETHPDVWSAMTTNSSVVAEWIAAEIRKLKDGK